MESNLESLINIRDIQSGNGRVLPAVIASAPIVIYVLDNEGVFTLSTGKGLEALGLKEGEVVGQSVFDIYRDQLNVIEDIQRALDGEAFSSNEKVGNLVKETRFTPIHDLNGEVNGVIGVSFEVTDKIQAEAVLHQQAKELSSL